ncbi:class I adenylate-forming enzyme family protein [[Mycobacterium] burgundiense]|uniref:AMP-binding protein n=1 Tax=[Mycobacterium] burgundiense TaxID=3064286 RepID=A0ABM9LT61_9MYCO|nr:AMP-binding protein [Mycolicibacterium sp. MU0053]CAJ1504290.1 AMP-binding protein [Mycolicibacterium sp. MU0053]
MHSPAHILTHAAEKFGDKPALITAERTLSYRELEEAANGVAHGLLERGVRPGQTVSLYSTNRWEWIVTYHGALKAGAVVNPVNVMLTRDELAYVLRDCAATAVFAGGEQAEWIRDLARDLPGIRAVVAFGAAPAGTTPFEALLTPHPDRPDVAMPGPTDPSTIGYTSGTTGHPKGAIQSHRAVLTNCALTATMHGRSAADIVVTALPAPHVYGNVAINSTFLTGGTVVLMQRFEPAAALRLIEQHRATMFEGVPAMYAMMLADPALTGTDLTSLTRCTVGGQTFPVATLEKWEAVSGVRLIELWGMTEIAGLGLTHAVHAPAVPGSVGVALPGVQVRIADLENSAVDAPAGEPGELMVRGPVVMLGYHDNPAATAETIEPDGWLHTGDIATMADTGHVFIVDRRKDMIISGGYNIYPAEIERVLSAHPGVALVAAGPVPDPVKGELPCAYVVRAPGSTVTEAELADFAGTRLAAYKRPRLFSFVDALPTTSSGKVMRRALRDLRADTQSDTPERVGDTS